MDITLLPEPVFIGIMKYLSPEDLLSCSLVNISWRNAVNCNDIWRCVCRKCFTFVNGNELDHLPTDLSKCTGFYSAPSFEPLCKWRKSFMRWWKLEDNWKRGRYKLFTTTEEISTLCPIECDDNVALIVNYELGKISVWNIKHQPYHQEDIKFMLHHVCSEFVELCNNYLVIVQCNLLQVFRSTESGFIPHLMCIFDKDESFVNLLPSDDMTEWYCSNIDLYPCDLTLRCGLNGNKFIGLILGENNENILHIWDFNKNIKNAEALIPKSSNNINDINFSNVDDRVYLMMTLYGTYWYHTFYVYDLNDFKFLDFKLHLNYVVAAFIVYKNLIVTVDTQQNRINMWENSDKCKVLECNYKIDLKYFNVESPHLIIGGGNSLGEYQTTVSIYHLENFKFVFSTNLSYIVNFISLVRNKFLAIDGISYHPFISVIDILQNCCLYVIENSDSMFINSTHSKLLTRYDNNLSLISFW